ncbi:MAG: DUF4230 domain-containing protein [Muribaculaceae bacterium]|nr:DUF4230 domain-containing protein [Muribaculaceae bacterium]
MKSRLMIIIALCSLLTILAGCGEKQEPVDFYEQLHNVKRLELGRMTVRKVGMIEDPHTQTSGVIGKVESLLQPLKYGKRIGVYSYDTYLVAYIDLSRLQPGDVTVDEENKRVTVSLPPIEIMTDGREPELHEDHYRVTGMRSQITPQERAALKRRMAAEVKKEMENDTEGKNRLKQTAEIKAKGWVLRFLREQGYDAEVEILD